MKTFVAISTFAVLAIAFVFVDASQNHLQRRQDDCPESQLPSINTTEPVTCDKRGRRPIAHAIRVDRCSRQCRRCYNPRELKNKPWACLVNGECQCLGRASNGTSTTQSDLSTTSENTATTANEVTTENNELTT